MKSLGIKHYRCPARPGEGELFSPWTRSSPATRSAQAQGAGGRAAGRPWGVGPGWGGGRQCAGHPGGRRQHAHCGVGRATRGSNFGAPAPPPPNRLSVSWPRVIPKGCATCPINAKGLKFYVDLVKELIANGIEPAVTL